MNDRIIVKADSQGPLVFLADSLKTDAANTKKGSLLAWRAKNGAEPFNVSLDFYKATHTPSDTQVKNVVKEYEKAWGGDPVVMQRLPRVVNGQARFVRKASEARKPVDNPQEAPAKQSYVMRNLGEGIWHIVSQETKESVAYVTSEKAALDVLKELMGEDVKFQH